MPTTVPNRPRRGDRAEAVEEALHPVHEVAADVLDALAHLVAGAMAHVQRRREQRAQRRSAAQRIDVRRLQSIAARGPGPDFVAEARRQHRIATQAPEAFDDDRHARDRQQQQRNHRPAAGPDQFQHARLQGRSIGPIG
jgi:hypothetical protein